MWNNLQSYAYGTKVKLCKTETIYKPCNPWISSLPQLFWAGPMVLTDSMQDFSRKVFFRVSLQALTELKLWKSLQWLKILLLSAAGKCLLEAANQLNNFTFHCFSELPFWKKIWWRFTWYQSYMPYLRCTSLSCQFQHFQQTTGHPVSYRNNSHPAACRSAMCSFWIPFEPCFLMG